MLHDDIWRYLPFGAVPTLLLASSGAAAAVYVAVVRSPRSRRLAVAMLVVSVLVILAFTARGSVANADGGFSWRVGASIRAELHNINRSLGVINVVGNVVMFVPIGWLVAVLSTRRPVLLGTVCALALSTAVETWQMLSGSFGDIDDILLNATGGLVGAVGAVLLGSLGRRSPAAGRRAAPADLPT